MIRGGFLSPSQRAELLALLRSGRSDPRVVRRANAMLLLDDGWSCERVAEALYLDDDTVRSWRKIYDQEGLKGLERFEVGGSSSHLSKAQEEALVAWVAATLPRSTRQVGAYVERGFGVGYESRAGLIALSPRSSRAGVAGAAGTARQAALHSRLLPTFEPDRALVGRHARTSDAQQMPCALPRVRQCDARFPTRKSPPKLAEIL